MKHVLKLSTFLLVIVLLMSVFTTMPTSVVFAGFTPTPTSPPPATETPVPPSPTDTPVPPPTSDSGGTSSGTPTEEMTPTPIPTPEAIPELGGGPGTSQMSLMGFGLLGIFVLLGFSWWRTWQLYQKE